MEERTAQLKVYLSAETLQRLRRWADEERQRTGRRASMSLFVEEATRQALDEREAA